MAGIYLHIPFCKQACHYCNFHFSTSLRYKKELVAALAKEISLQKEYFNNEVLETIYFGGGTPSLLDQEDIDKLLNHLHINFSIGKNAEVTLEANPDDIHSQRLSDWKQSGINRLSIGVQSFFEEDLKWMNRAHSSAQAVSSLKDATKYFDNITADLIYGIPGLTNERWKQNVDRMIGLQIPHLSCYALTIEPKTPLDKLIRQHKKEKTDSDIQAEQFLLLMQWLEKAGYEHYEISNFAKPGFRSRHNSSYWQGKKYLGIGPAAHSYNGSCRHWNIANNAQYIKSINEGIIPSEKEELTTTQQLNEYIMTSLRTIEGINLEFLHNKFAVTQKEFLKKVEKQIDTGLIRQHLDFLILTSEGKLLADGVAADLFY
ncbi:MAG: radical SAM family heme chaperone HemW [Bacteroidetes bacterium]|nr:radical SAM family heme chaperone HemW [Bacteroidota bacterium]